MFQYNTSYHSDSTCTGLADFIFIRHLFVIVLGTQLDFFFFYITSCFSPSVISFKVVCLLLNYICPFDIFQPIIILK